MEFEWDEDKARINVARHGLDFELVMRAWANPVFSYPDTREDYGEERMIGFGAIGASVIVIVFTERGSNIRLISARKAKKHEQRYYYSEVFG